MTACFICGSDQRCPHREPANLRAYPERLYRTEQERRVRVVFSKPVPWKMRRAEYLAATGRQKWIIDNP